MPRKVTQRKITPPQFIRQHLLRMTVSQFAAALGVASSIVTRYEQQGVIPDRHHQAVVDLAKRRGVRLLTKWFKRIPWEQNARMPD